MLKKLVKLKKNSNIAICASASSFSKLTFEKNIKLLNNFKLTYSKSIFNKYYYTAGTSSARSIDLNNKLKSKNIDALFFARGGYGSINSLDKIKSIPNKIIMGYSDITSVLLYAYKINKTPVFYGPNITSSFFTKKILTYLTSDSKYPIYKKLTCINTPKNINAPIIGGCLSVICSLIGTPYLPSFDNHILFIEDTNEAPYKIDRYLQQLYYSGILDNVKAILIGSMKNCSRDWKIPFKILSSKFKKPIYYGLNIGHSGFDFPLVFGVPVKITGGVLEIPSPFKKEHLC